MKLPQNSIGPTDIQQHRDCPARFEFGMRRHTEIGEAPEATSPDNAYGSAVHDCLHLIEKDGLSDAEAVTATFKRWNAWLDVEDLAMLKEDIATYRLRDNIEQGGQFVTVLNEGEISVPLMEYGGETIYFRGRIDRLYQSTVNPGVFVHRDYKSSKWRRSEEEVHSDPQLWGYNFGLFDFFPEMETLVQIYDQLRYGEVRTQKSPEQRQMMREWLQEQAIAILEDTELNPKFNRWCPWCPLLESCGVVRDLSDFATTRLVALAPPRKIGRKTIIELDPDLFEVYLEQLETVGTARTALERFEKAVKEALREMPSERRHRLGYELREPSASVFTAEALQAAHEVLGDSFYDLVNMTKTAIENAPVDEGKKAAVLAMAERTTGAPRIGKAR